ncbi:MAG: DUF2304 domain-containing protein [Acidobacteria bacterium]|nr:DUF2304 domain-containing protein [Acidobacteriota bacterium]
MFVPLTLHQTIFAVGTSIVVFVLLIELVRRRHLREEYAWLWLLTGAAMILLVSWPRLLAFVTHAIGAATPLTTLLIFSLLFLLAIVVHYSVMISRLTMRVKNLTQELALLASRLDGVETMGTGPSPAPHPGERPAAR